MPIRAILFDLDETLLIEYASVEGAFLATCALAEEKHNVPAARLHPAVLDACRELYHAFPLYPWCNTLGLSSWEVLSGDVSGKYPELDVLVRWQPWFRMESWRRGLRAFDVEDLALAQAMAEAFVIERNRRHELFPETLGVLDALEGNYRLGLVTNGAANIQRNKLEKSGLENRFRPLVISGEHGVGKPDPKLLRVALRKLRCKADEVILVGDRLDTDVKMAAAAGKKSVWVNRNHQTPPADAPKPTATISNLTELEAALKTL
ncbi:MAG: HAD family hydrolase [Phycisphaerae bacterium]|nr:HAD family hydrolase [Phycisphaerae bacterium]